MGHLNSGPTSSKSLYTYVCITTFLNLLAVRTMLEV